MKSRSNHSAKNRKLAREVQQDIRRKLRRHKALHRVHCSFSNGTLTLWGSVSGNELLQVATDIGWSNRNVEAIDSVIETVPSEMVAA